MCQKSGNLCKTICLIVFASVLLSFLPLDAGAYIQPIEPQTTIKMSVEQYSQLKTIINRQDDRLEVLQKKLSMLKMNSTEASNELIRSQNELTRLKQELTTTKESLVDARISLNQAEEILKKQDESLKILNKQIKTLEHKQVVTRRQRDVWALLFTFSIGEWVASR